MKTKDLLINWIFYIFIYIFPIISVCCSFNSLNLETKGLFVGILIIMSIFQAKIFTNEDYFNKTIEDLQRKIDNLEKNNEKK